jgi:DNA mismatch endonuclease (patch repair protein)
MTDHLTKEKRSWNMSRIRHKNTKPELIIRSLLHRMGYRFTVNGPGNRNLPGRPDIVLPKYKTVVFVHGCFWHFHRNCKHARIPKTRTEWWRDKLRGNAERDKKKNAELRRQGWKVITVWECQIKGKLNMIEKKITRHLPSF